MKITKAECLEFLQANRITCQKYERVYGLLLLVEWLNGEWPSAVSALKAAIKGAKLRGNKTYSIKGFTRREFGRMVWAKNEIKRRQNVRKVRADMMPKHIDCRCVMKPLMSNSKFQSKVISEKMKGVIDSRLHDSLFADAASKAIGVDKAKDKVERSVVAYISPCNLSGWRGGSFYDFIEASELKTKAKKDDSFAKLKTEQEEKKMRDSNAETSKFMIEIGSEYEIAASTEHLKISKPEGEVVKVYAKFKSDRGTELFAFINDSGTCGGVGIAEMFRPISIKTERQKAIKFYLSQVSMGMVQGVYKANEEYYRFAIESLIDSGYLNTKTPPIAR